jgi:hypothetical protein
MELFLTICTIPLALVASLLVAALATALQTRAQLLRNRWGTIGLVAVWGIVVLVLTVVAITLFSANEYYKCGVGPKSTLPSTTITDLESKRIEVLVEYSLRIHLGRSKYDDTCHTTQEICVLADGVMDQAARQYFATGIGYGDVMNIVGLATAIPAVLLFAAVLLLNKKIKVDAQKSVE